MCHNQTKRRRRRSRRRKKIPASEGDLWNSLCTGFLSVSNQRNPSQGCRISPSGSGSGDFRVEGAGDGFLECTHLHSSLSLTEQREEVGEMRGRLLSCELHLPGVRGSIVNSDLVPSTVYIYYPSHLIYTSLNRKKPQKLPKSCGNDKVARLQNCYVQNARNPFVTQVKGNIRKRNSREF